MICQRCLLRLERSGISRRAYASAAKISPKSSNVPPPTAPRGSGTETHEGPPAATSTSAAQPFSAKDGSKARSLGPSGSAAQIESYPTKKSTVPAGKPLTGLGYLKNKDPPVAAEDHEYPAWLWQLLDSGDSEGTGAGAILDGNLYAKSKAQRRKAIRAARKAAMSNPDLLLPRVPIEHQTIDLPAGDGTLQAAIEAGNVREELRSAMRRRRRAEIKESNYLKGMS